MKMISYAAPYKEKYRQKYLAKLLNLIHEESGLPLLEFGRPDLKFAETLAIDNY